jgi:hypothetical protein
MWHDGPALACLQKIGLWCLGFGSGSATQAPLH